jgi:hypothetical protein
VPVNDVVTKRKLSCDLRAVWECAVLVPSLEDSRLPDVTQILKILAFTER